MAPAEPRKAAAREWQQAARSGRQWSGGNLASSAYRGLEGAFDGPAVPTGVRGQKVAASHPGLCQGHIPEVVPF